MQLKGNVMNYIKSVEEVRASVTLIAGTAGKLQDRIHRTAVSVLKLFHDKVIDGNEASELLTAIQGASPYHSSAFAKWVGLMTEFQWTDEDKDNKRWYAHKDYQIMGKAFIVARDTPFWTVSPPAEPKPFDLIAVLQREIAKADRRTENKDKAHEDDVIPQPLVRALKDLVGKFEVA